MIRTLLILLSLTLRKFVQNAANRRTGDGVAIGLKAC